MQRDGYGGLRQCPESWLDDDTIVELAGETVAAALRYFKFKVLMANKWNAAKGASLATFFVGQCKRQFANVYDRWFTDRRNNQLVPDEEAGDWRASTPGVAAQVVELITAEQLLDRLSSPLAKEIFRKKFLARYTYEEIAESTEGVVNAKAAENIVTKERKRLRDEVIGSHAADEEPGQQVVARRQGSGPSAPCGAGATRRRIVAASRTTGREGISGIGALRRVT